jgi:aspartyl-tRNA(Asn)/glutamyl-tRNA(Gln) amidotransferase subunit A
MLRCIAGEAPRTEYVTLRGEVPDFRKAIGRGVKFLKVGLAADCGGGVDPAVAEGVRTAASVFAELGAKVEEVEFTPDPPDAIFATFFDYFSARAYQSHGRFLDDERSAALLTDYVHACLSRGKAQSATRHIECLNRMGYYRHYTREFFERYDLLLTAVTTVPPFPIGELQGDDAPGSDERRWGFFRTHLFNLTGNPAASLPVGLTADGRPLAAQLVGGFGDDGTVLAASLAFEEARPWHDYWPGEPLRSL